jgi:hypothetical protein
MIYNRPYSVVFARLLACCQDNILIRFSWRMRVEAVLGESCRFRRAKRVPEALRQFIVPMMAAAAK